MVIALARPLLQISCSSVVAISRSSHTDKDIPLGFLVQPISAVAPDNPIQSAVESCLSTKAILNTKIRSSPVSWDYNSSAFSGTLRSNNPNGVRQKKTWEPFLRTATIWCRSTQCGESFQDGEKDLVPIVQRQATAGEYDIPNSSLDRATLEKWLRNAVFEIIRNIRDAPFIHLVFDSQNVSHNSGRQIKLALENLNHPDRWTTVRDSIIEFSPVGLIFVEKLDQHECSDHFCLAEQKEPIISNSFPSGAKQTLDDSSSTDIWGILVEGKGIAWHACYILKTTRVETTAIGACTHFCLTKAKCCGSSVQDQLENTWLL